MLTSICQVLTSVDHVDIQIHMSGSNIWQHPPLSIVPQYPVLELLHVLLLLPPLLLMLLLLLLLPPLLMLLLLLLPWLLLPKRQLWLLCSCNSRTYPQNDYFIAGNESIVLRSSIASAGAEVFWLV
jgi:hypothetical protein